MRKLLIGIPLLCALLWGATSGNINWTQLASGSRHGTAAKGQASDGTGTVGHVATFDSGGSITDGGAAPAGGSVTSVATTSPITGGPITSTGTIACATCTVTVASGTSAMGTGAISSAACASTVTTSATGTASTDAITASFNADPTSTTGYAPLTTGMLTIIAWPTTNNVNWKVCNNTASSITPGAVTLNWRVTR